MLLVVLLVSSVQLVPGRNPLGLGIESLVAGLVAWVAVCMQQRANLRVVERPYPGIYAAHIAMGQLATLPFIAAGIGLIASWEAAIDIIAAGVVLAFIDAFYIGWVLLIEINR